jgi:hypothetical protein
MNEQNFPPLKKKKRGKKRKEERKALKEKY